MSTTLTQDEFFFLRIFFGRHRYEETHSIADTMREMWNYSIQGADYLIESLAEKKVLATSPDGYSFKITDVGIEILEAKLLLQNEWEKPGIVRVLNRSAEESIIPAGNHFVGQRLMKLMFSEATTSLDIIDPYIGSDLFDRIHDSEINVPIRIVTGPQAKRCVSYYEAFKETYGPIEMRILEAGTLHDRFILINNASGYQLGHSAKDLGKRDTRISKIDNVSPVIALFEQRWRQAKPSKEK